MDRVPGSSCCENLTGTGEQYTAEDTVNPDPRVGSWRVRLHDDGKQTVIAKSNQARNSQDFSNIRDSGNRKITMPNSEPDNLLRDLPSMTADLAGGSLKSQYETIEVKQENSDLFLPGVEPSEAEELILFIESLGHEIKSDQDVDDSASLFPMGRPGLANFPAAMERGSLAHPEQLPSCVDALKNQPFSNLEYVADVVRGVENIKATEVIEATDIVKSSCSKVKAKHPNKPNKIARRGKKKLHSTQHSTQSSNITKVRRVECRKSAIANQPKFFAERCQELSNEKNELAWVKLITECLQGRDLSLDHLAKAVSVKMWMYDSMDKLKEKISYYLRSYDCFTDISKGEIMKSHGGFWTYTKSPVTNSDKLNQSSEGEVMRLSFPLHITEH